MFFPAGFPILSWRRVVSLRGPAGRNLKFILLQRLERRRPAAQGVILGDLVEYVDAAVVEQRRLGNLALGPRRADRTALQRFFVHILDGLETMAIGAFVFVQRHD